MRERWISTKGLRSKNSTKNYAQLCLSYSWASLAWTYQWYAQCTLSVTAMMNAPRKPANVLSIEIPPPLVPGGTQRRFQYIGRLRDVEGNRTHTGRFPSNTVKLWAQWWRSSHKTRLQLVWQSCPCAYDFAPPRIPVPATLRWERRTTRFAEYLLVPEVNMLCDPRRPKSTEYY